MPISGSINGGVAGGTGGGNSGGGGTPIAFQFDIFTGDGSTTAFTLTKVPDSLASLDVSVGGVTQLPDIDYTWTSGKTITFAVALPSGVKALVRYGGW